MSIAMQNKEHAPGWFCFVIFIRDSFGIFKRKAFMDLFHGPRRHRKREMIGRFF